MGASLLRCGPLFAVKLEYCLFLPHSDLKILASLQLELKRGIMGVMGRFLL